MEIIVPFVDKDEKSQDRKAFLYKVIARVRPGIDGIEINQDDELYKFNNLVKELFGDNTHIEIQINPMNNSKRLDDDLDQDNMPSMTLGIFLAIEAQINNRAFKENYDYLIVTGDIVGKVLKAIDDEDKKIAALELFLENDNNKGKKAKFIYVKDYDSINLKNEFQNIIDIQRFYENTSYEEILASLFSEDGDTIEYYASYVDQNGLPKGIRKLTLEEVKKREDSFRFISKNKKLLKVEHINRKGKIHHHKGKIDEPIIQEFDYPAQNIIKVSCKTKTGQIQFIKEIKKDSSGLFNRINFFNSDETECFHLDNNYNFFDLTTSFITQISKAEIRGYLIDRNECGFIVKKRFIKFQNTEIIQANSQGIFGYEYEINELGLPVCEYYLGSKCERTTLYDEIYCKKIIYDDLGTEIEHQLLKRDGSLIYIQKTKRDDVGNIIEVCFYDNKQKEMNGPEGYHRAIWNYYSNNTFSIEYKDKYGNLIESKNGYARAEIRLNYQGYNDYFTYYDKNLNPTYAIMEDSKYAAREDIYNEAGLIIENRYFDIYGEPMKGASGTEIIQHKYDIRGNLIEDRYCDKDYNLELDNNNVAILEIEYDKYDRKTIEKNFGIDHKLLKNSFGYAIKRIEYNERTGNFEAVSYFDENETPIINKEGYHKIIMSYNEKGLCIRINLLDTEEKLLDGICSYVLEYDQNGDCSECRTYNKYGNLQNNEKGFAIQSTLRTELEEIQELRNNRGIIVSRINNTYDNNGNIIKETIFENEEFKYCTNWIYDESQNRVSEYYSNEQGIMMASKYGFASQKFIYDSRNNLVEKIFLDENNNLYNYNGYAKIKYKYNNANLIIQTCAYTKNGDIMEVQDSVYGYNVSYNSDFLPDIVQYLDRAKKPLKYDNHGISKIKVKYLSNEKCIFCYLNLKNKVINEQEFNYEIKDDKTVLNSKKIIYSNKEKKWIYTIFVNSN